MESKIVIFCMVDVIEALSTKTLLNGNLCMMDNSTLGSANQGTTELTTLCTRGQLIEWTMVAVDVQTPAEIKSITFLGPDNNVESQCVSNAGFDSSKLHLNVWSGYVPWWMKPGVEYRYRLEVQMYEGVNSVMCVETPSLKLC